MRLFRRLNPGLELTDEGHRYLAVVDPVLEQLAAAQEALAPRGRPLRISALDSFSETWLIPNLPDFERAHPGIELLIEATLRYADFARDPVDVAIRFGRGPWEGLHSEPLVELETFPVASPGLASGEPPLRVPADLAHHTLIHVAQTPDAWTAWLRAAGVPALEPRRHVTYDHAALALSAAESGPASVSTPSCAAPAAGRQARPPFRGSARARPITSCVGPRALSDRRIAGPRLAGRTAGGDGYAGGTSANAKWNICPPQGPRAGQLRHATAHLVGRGKLEARRAGAAARGEARR